MFLGLVTDRGVLSVGMISLVTYTVLRSPWPKAWKDFVSRKDMLFLALIFVIYAFSGLYSQNLDLLAERLRIKLPFLLLPFAFAQLKPYTEKQFAIIQYIFLGILSIAGLAVLINYLAFFDSITESMMYGKAIPTPYSHIRFSLFVVFAFFTGLEVLRAGVKLKFNWEKPVVIVCTVFLFILCHILAVRSGLLALYLGLFFWIIYYFVKTKKVLLGSVFLLLLVCIPYLSYKFIPTLNSKINYMLYDLKMMSSDTSQEYSDRGRLISIKVGWELIQQNLWFG